MEVKIEGRKIFRNLSNLKVRVHVHYMQFKISLSLLSPLVLPPSLPSSLFSLSYYQSRVGSGGNTSAIPVTVSSFTGNHLIVRVNKRPGMEKANLLLSDTESQQAPPNSSPGQNGGIIDSITK